MRIVALTQQEAERFRDQIVLLYYRNMRACAHMESFTYEDACRKMDDLVFHLGNGTCVAYVALDGDEVCGFVWAYPHRWRDEERMYVSEIRVREGWRRRGIGTELLRLVEERAREMGLGALYLHAEADNPDAVRLYESLGYELERVQLRKGIG